MMKKSGFTIGLLAMLLALPVYGASVNSSVTVGKGRTVEWGQDS